MSEGRFTPNAGAAPFPRMVLAQALMETKLLLRNGEQLLLTIAIPAVLLLLFSAVPIIDLGTTKRIDFLAPGIFALAIMSSAFTGQAILTAFERRYGLLKRLAITPLSRSGLILGKTVAIIFVVVVQLVVLCVVALALGWSPHLSVIELILLLILGTAAFSGLGLLMAGTLRAEATLGAANLVFLLLLVLGGVIVPLVRFPAVMRPLLEALPITALSLGLRGLFLGAAVPITPFAILAAWALLSIGAAVATFRWE